MQGEPAIGAGTLSDLGTTIPKMQVQSTPALFNSLLAEQPVCSEAIAVQVLRVFTVLQQGFLLSLSISLVLCRLVAKIQSRL